ncbi:hypothetical protein C8Q70DRAFT_1050035 [Cubamyces menziesii]|nr:hypothetical protein C8Q70DRAFT_1050035 [Cubamyces menziesii]
MDPHYPYYTATNTGQTTSSAQDHHSQHPQQPHPHPQSQHHQLRPHQSQAQAYPSRSPEPPAGHAYTYPHTQLPSGLPGNYSPYPPQHPQGSSYHPPTPQAMSGTLPPLGHSQAYSRGATQGDRYDSGSQGAFVPSIGPTLQDLPFTPGRAASAGADHSQVARHSGSWGSTHGSSSSSRSPPLYDRRGIPPSPTYPPTRSGTQHPSLSHSTQLIPTPAQTVQTYHGYGSVPSSPGGSIGGPVIAAIPASSGSIAPQERFYCDKCDKSFGRAHDKKRHYESAHLQTHHECRFCHKCFSRNDSLKRHQDNGCEKDPNFHT